jgi:hypothetical protein
MNEKALEEIRHRLTGRQILFIEPSKWSGPVRSLTPNSGYFSMTLDDGTIIEVGSLLIHEKEPKPESQLS